MGEYLDPLLAVAARRDRPADQIWPAAAGGIQLLWWNDQFADAADLTIITLRDLRTEPGKLFTQDVPFAEAPLAAALYRDEPPLTTLRETLNHVPAETILGKRLLWLIDNVGDGNDQRFLGGQGWHRPSRPLRSKDQELAERDPHQLSPTEQQRLFEACHAKKQYPTAQRLWETTGAYPDRWPAAAWMAGHLTENGHIEVATAILQHALPTWIPYTTWDLLPTDVVLQPRLRNAMTPPLRTQFLDSVDISGVPGIGE